MARAEPGVEGADDLRLPLVLDVSNADPPGGGRRRDGGPSGPEPSPADEGRHVRRAGDGGLPPDDAEVDPRRGDPVRPEGAGGSVEGLAARQEAGVGDEVPRAECHDHFRQRSRQAEVVGVEDEPDHRGRRVFRSCRSSGTREAKSFRIRRITRGDERVETPRVLGK